MAGESPSLNPSQKLSTPMACRTRHEGGSTRCVDTLQDYRLLDVRAGRGRAVRPMGLELQHHDAEGGNRQVIRP
jgi:hypothetical protein